MLDIFNDYIIYNPFDSVSFRFWASLELFSKAMDLGLDLDHDLSTGPTRLFLSGPIRPNKNLFI